ncbi:MAG: hypothetical protein H7A40_00455 [Chlamydiales bacterium]|nr:hypothetical protein [Chlamydiales bacterium]
MNVGALTGAVKAQPIKVIEAICLTTLVAKVLLVAYNQLKDISLTASFDNAKNWVVNQFVVKHDVIAPKEGEEKQVTQGEEKPVLESKICWSKTAAQSLFSTVALGGAVFLGRFAFNQIRG